MEFVRGNYIDISPTVYTAATVHHPPSPPSLSFFPALLHFIFFRASEPFCSPPTCPFIIFFSPIRVTRLTCLTFLFLSLLTPSSSLFPFASICFYIVRSLPCFIFLSTHNFFLYPHFSPSFSFFALLFICFFFLLDSFLLLKFQSHFVLPFHFYHLPLLLVNFTSSVSSSSDILLSFPF